MTPELTRRSFLTTVALTLPALSLAEAGMSPGPQDNALLQADKDADTTRSFLVSLFQIYKSDLESANQFGTATQSVINSPVVCRRVLSGLKGNPELTGERASELLTKIPAVAGSKDEKALEAGIQSIIDLVNS